MKNGKRILSVTIETQNEEYPDASYLEQEGFEKRLAEYRNDQFGFIGIRAKATVRFPYMTEGKGGRTYYQTQEFVSGGLWGIESDSDASYLEEIAQEELSDLRNVLKTFGLSTRAISKAFKTAFKTVEKGKR